MSSTKTSSSTTSSSTSSTSATTTSSTNTGNATTSSSQTGTASSTPFAKSGSSGLSAGVVAGVAIGAFVVGALIASIVVFILSKKRERRRRSQGGNALGTTTTSNRPDEKSARTNVDVIPQNEAFDMDRLLPQPFDDSRIKGDVQLLFTQIEGHIENFYTENKVSSKTQISADESESEMLLYPATRFPALKRMICLVMLEAISLTGPSEQSLLPLGLGQITRQLNGINLDDQANVLCWARLRSSMGYLLKPDLDATEQKRLDRAIGAIVARLNAKTQAFELAGTSNQRAADMDAVCRSSATLGRVLLSQPAEWRFDWRGTAGTRSELVYFPSLVRLTDNKGKKLRTPHVAIQAKSTQGQG